MFRADELFIEFDVIEGMVDLGFERSVDNDVGNNVLDFGFRQPYVRITKQGEEQAKLNRGFSYLHCDFLKNRFLYYTTWFVNRTIWHIEFLKLLKVFHLAQVPKCQMKA